MQTTKPSLLTIGDCVLFPVPDNRYIGLILQSITRTIEYTTYDFLKAGKTFDQRPTKEEFLAAGLLGRRVPSRAEWEEVQDRSYIEKGKYSKMYDRVGIMAEDLEAIRHRMEVLTNISFSKANFPKSGSFGMFESVEELVEWIEDDVDRIGKIEDSSQIEQEVFPTEAILASGEDRMEKEIEERWILSKKSAHSNALRLLDEDFFWDGIDEFAPFGSDAGSDALHGFREWRAIHQEVNPIDYLPVLENQWDLSFDHLNELDPEEIESFHGDIKFFIHVDQAVLGVCFGQLVLEGKISEPLLQLGELALKRQLHPKVMELYDELCREEREIKLEKQMEMLRQLGKNSGT